MNFFVEDTIFDNELMDRKSVRGRGPHAREPPCRQSQQNAGYPGHPRSFPNHHHHTDNHRPAKTAASPTAAQETTGGTGTSR